ncbi:hypothetical protein FRC03_003366 [Tulasnella sp. 419]|nr:hypothetical protein FRC03_003366 [Tulasnella sp. 419]
MLSRFVLGLLALSSILIFDTVADVVTVGARNRAISYQNASTWTLLPPSRGSCGRYQMVTKQTGDYAAFEFEGDSIAVFGGVGVYGGIIEIDLDGVANYTIDRYRPSPRCGVRIFLEDSLQFGPHRISLTLVDHLVQEEGETGLLSIQSIRYTRPMEPAPHIPSVIATGAVAFVALLGAIALQWLRTKRRQKSFQKPTDDLSYDLSGLLVLSKTQSISSTSETTSACSRRS